MTTPARKRTTPSFQFYPTDFLASAKVDAMSMTERGAYITLLARAWSDNGLPINLVALAGYCRMKPTQFERIWAGPLGQCFEERGGRYVNPRQEHERRKQQDFRRRQSDNGKRGGRPSQTHEEPKPLPDANPLESPREEKRRNETEQVEVISSSEGSLRGDPPMDTWARELVNLYPAQGRCGWNLVERPLFMALTGDGGDPWATWDLLRAQLEQHKRSHQWRVKQMIPRLDKWLREGMFLQELPETPVTSVVSERTARNLSSAAEFIKAGERGAH